MRGHLKEKHPTYAKQSRRLAVRYIFPMGVGLGASSLIYVWEVMSEGPDAPLTIVLGVLSPVVIVSWILVMRRTDFLRRRYVDEERAKNPPNPK